jgi:hypothetical protein
VKHEEDHRCVTRDVRIERRHTEVRITRRRRTTCALLEHGWRDQVKLDTVTRATEYPCRANGGSVLIATIRRQSYQVTCLLGLIRIRDGNLSRLGWKDIPV